MGFGGYLQANTAVDVLIGPFVDLTDCATAEEGESPTVLLSKNGQALAAKNDATGPTHDDAGYYNCELDETDTNTEGTLTLIVEKSATALPVRHDFMVLAQAAYISLVTAKDSGYMDVDVKAIVTGTQSATDLKDFVDTGYDPATHKVAGVVLTDTCTTNTDLVTAATIADAVWDEAAAGHTDAGKAGEQLWTDVDAILADTNELQTDDTPGAIAALENLSAADVNAEVVDVLKTDTIAEMAQGAPSATPTFESAINYLYRRFRNKTETTATLCSLYNDAGNAVLCKSVLGDDGTTFTMAEWITGA